MIARLRAPTPLTAAGGHVPSRLADFDHDRSLDVVTVDYERNDVSIFPGDGDGGFGSPRHEHRYRLESVEVADFDADGNPDLSVSSDAVPDVLTAAATRPPRHDPVL